MLAMQQLLNPQPPYDAAPCRSLAVRDGSPPTNYAKVHMQLTAHVRAETYFFFTEGEEIQVTAWLRSTCEAWRQRGSGAVCCALWRENVNVRGAVGIAV